MTAPRKIERSPRAFATSAVWVGCVEEWGGGYRSDPALGIRSGFEVLRLKQEGVGRKLCVIKDLRETRQVLRNRNGSCMACVCARVGA